MPLARQAPGFRTVVVSIVSQKVADVFCWQAAAENEQTQSGVQLMGFTTSCLRKGTAERD